MSDRTTAVYLGDHTALTRTVYGHKLYVDTRDLSLTPHLLMDGAWEMWITRALEELIEPGMTVVDVGANVGWYTLLAAERVGPSGRVVAFEANPETVALLRRTVDVNGARGWTTVEPVALADREGEITLHALAEHRGTSSISRRAGSRARASAPRRRRSSCRARRSTPTPARMTCASTSSRSTPRVRSR
jgi:FkbM family methyltransferase